MELTAKQKQVLADRRANDPLYWEQVRDHAQPVPMAVQNQTDFGNIYAERLDQRGVPRKGMTTLNAPAAKPLAMPTPVQDGPYRQAQMPKPMARVSELSDKTALTVRPAIGIRPGMYYAQDGTLRAIPFKQQPIGAVKGFPETGTNAWRAGNDGAIVDGVNAHHVRHGFLPGDEQFMTPSLVKSWTMKESGGDRARFESDPLTANHSGDWTADKERMLGLRHRQAMAPDTSVSAGLEWLLHRGTYNDAEVNGALASTYRGRRGALERYKGKETYRETPQQYAAKIFGWNRDSFGDES
jgi:hypothetical protein